MNHDPTENNMKAMDILTRMFSAEFKFMQSDGSDLTGIAASFHPNVVVHIPDSLPYSGHWCGHEEIGRLFRQMSRVWSSMDVQNIRATLDGDMLFMSGMLVATLRHSGAEIRQPFAETLKLEDGLVVEGFPFYYDTFAINSALEEGSHKSD